MEKAVIKLHQSTFSDNENTIFASKGLTALAFKYSSGVCALRMKNELGELIVLPFQGQQIWRAVFCGQDLTMKSTFKKPYPTRDFLATYGGFLLHCGATAMGVPGTLDHHPRHGELPNIPYDEASLVYGEDQNGRFLALTGHVQYYVAFSVHYSASPTIKLYENSSIFHINMQITNLRSKPMDYMYLCHINFRPVDGSRLIYSAPADPSHVKAHMSIPDHMPSEAASALRDHINRINSDPGIHHIVDSSTQIYDPEIVMTIHYLADKEGYAHSMQVLPNGGAFYVAHRTIELPLGLRWIARTGDEDAMGLVLPSTAEHKGFTNARENNLLKTLGPNENVTMSIKAGYVDGKAVESINTTIEKIKFEKE